MNELSVIVDDAIDTAMDAIVNSIVVTDAMIAAYNQKMQFLAEIRQSLKLDNAEEDQFASYPTPHGKYCDHSYNVRLG